MNRSDEPFLSRWSRLKHEGAHKHPDRALPAGDSEADKGRAAAGSARTPDATDGTGDARERAARQHGEARLEDVKSIDIDALDFDLDFECFMRKGVPDELRNKALRKLWTSNPIFGHIDGLDDYCEDFSDAAWVSPDFKTAYQIGRGFLSEEEVAAAQVLDKPRPDAVATGQASATAASTSSAPDRRGNETAGDHSDVASVEVDQPEPAPAAELAMNDTDDSAQGHNSAPNGARSVKQA